MEDQYTKEKRWANEAAFFDAEEYSDTPLDPITVERYCRSNKPWLYPEFPFWTMGDINGKTILEVGCGNGTNAILMALRGANVVGIDISQRAIEAAQRKAERQGVAEQVTFICSPFELYTTSIKFDWVVGMAILHHFLPVLEQVIGQFRKFGDDHTRYLFAEPIAIARWLRKLRLMLPIPVRGTPDERPLESQDFAILRSALPGHLQVTYFGFLIRLCGFLIIKGNYERSPVHRRIVYDLLARLDFLLLQKLQLRTLASCGVIETK